MRIHGYSVRPVVALLLYVLLTQQLAGQQHPLATDWRRLANLPPGTPVIVETKAGDSYHGELMRVTDDAMRFESDERGAFVGRRKTLREFKRDDVLRVRRYSRAGSALASTGIGAAAGGSIGFAADQSSRSGEDRGLLTAVCLLFGALIGWGVGQHSTLVKGETVYIAP